MFNIVEKRRWFFLLSALVILPGIAIMLYSTSTTGGPFKLSIDFVGGSIYELKFLEEGATEANIREVFAEHGEDNIIIQRLGSDDEYNWSIRAGFENQETTDNILAALDQLVVRDGESMLDQDSLRIERVSETVGKEVTQAAFWAVAAAATIVTGFIVIAFRQVPNAIRYGLCAIAAMVHDVLVVMGVMSLMGLWLGWEIDALFLTAVLTVVGFSVQDSIVLFDRIRENIPKHIGQPYETIVNRSIWETIHRSLATQLNAFFIMIAILLFGGETIKQFIAILFVGLLSGTYSSIFTAVPLLVSWEKGEIPFIAGDDIFVAEE
jgi:preprotein translocase SecF subunit